jgi:hypothetical protein
LDGQERITFAAAASWTILLLGAEQSEGGGNVLASRPRRDIDVGPTLNLVELFPQIFQEATVVEYLVDRFPDAESLWRESLLKST